ncbi:MAG: methyl-accepting chemotaxis protein [Roseburia sp.]
MEKAKKMSKKKPRNKSEQPKKMKQPGQKKNYNFFGIGTKMLGGFLVPILFMILVGVTAYQKSAQGLTQKFEQSALQTLDMATEYFDLSNSYLKTEAIKFAFDSSLAKYFSNSLDELETAETVRNTRTSINLDVSSNDFISNIHIITKAGVGSLTSANTNKPDGFLEEYTAELLEKGMTTNWIDSHDVLDEKLNIRESSYIMAYQANSRSGNAYVVVDINGDEVKNFLSGMDFGEGSIVGFVTPRGREVLCGDGAEGLEEGSIFYNQEFFQNSLGAEELSGYSSVHFQGGSYLYLYSRSKDSGATICVLVPSRTVLKQAEEIKVFTAIIVVIAVLVAVAVGIFIITGIKRNMNRISRKLERVAEGDLTGNVSVKGRDEFNSLASSATDMISQTRNLVRKVNGATEQLEQSAEDVNEVSRELSEYSSDITHAIDEINEGMGKQSSHAQECVDKTDSLSAEIKEVIRVSQDVEKMVGETEEMIEHGIEIVQNLGERSNETNEITARVGSSVAELKEQIDVINRFVGTITDIAEQTNLLSLNASIEAARAGEAGRGFAVVAEQIRKLSDDSAAAAGEIRENVAHISTQTNISVENTKAAEEMVALQTASVEEVIGVFRNMSESMNTLIDGLKDIALRTERADEERSGAVEAVRIISDIIEENAGNAETVGEIAARMYEKVEKLNRTSEALGGNMTGLKREIEVFKTEE